MSPLCVRGEVPRRRGAKAGLPLLQGTIGFPGGRSCLPEPFQAREAYVPGHEFQIPIPSASPAEFGGDGDHPIGVNTCIEYSWHPWWAPCPRGSEPEERTGGRARGNGAKAGRPVAGLVQPAAGIRAFCTCPQAANPTRPRPFDPPILRRRPSPRQPG